MDDDKTKKSSETQPDETQTGEALPDEAVDAVAGGNVRLPKFVIPDYV